MAETGPDAEQQRLLDAQKETAQSIEWWTNIIILVSLGLLLLAFTPDSLVISDNAATEMPFIGSASIKLVLISGPLVLLLLRLFLSSYLSHWTWLERQVGHLKPTQEATLSVMRNRRLRRWAGFVHFPLVALVFVTTTWKGLAFPLWGEAMALLTIGVIAWLTYRAARSGRVFNLSMLVIVIAGTAIAVFYDAMTDRSGALVTADTRREIVRWGARASTAATEKDEDDYEGSLICVACRTRHDENSRAQGWTRGPAADGTRTETEYTHYCARDDESDDPTGRIGSKDKALAARVRTFIDDRILPYRRFAVVQRKFNLSGADMERADLRFLHLEWASMTHANLTNALFRHARLCNATFYRADLVGADFADAILWQADLRRANLEQANFWDAKLRGAFLLSARLENARLGRADLTDATLRRATLMGANLRRATLIRADLSYADLTEATLARADLSNSNLQHAILRAADLSGAKFTDADLTNSDLQSAAFVGEGRRTGTLRAADLSGADLRCANLKGTDLTRVKGLKPEQLSCACMDAATELPQGWDVAKSCYASCKNKRSGNVLACFGAQ